MGNPAADSSARLLMPARVVKVAGVHVVLPVDHDAPERVIRRIHAHKDGEATDADILARARAEMMPNHYEFWRVIYDGFRVLATDGMPVTPFKAYERARNTMAGLLGSFTVQELQPARTNTFEEE